MNQRIKWSVLSFGTALALVLGLAMAQIGHAEHRFGWKHKPEQCDRKAHKHDHHFQILEDHAEELGLSKETLAKIEKIKDSSKESCGKLRNQIRDAKEELHKLMEQDKPDQQAVMKKVEDIGKLNLEKDKQRTSAMLEIHALLTKEQRAKLKELREECRKQCKRDRGEKDGAEDDEESEEHDHD